MNAETANVEELLHWWPNKNRYRVSKKIHIINYFKYEYILFPIPPFSTMPIPKLIIFARMKNDRTVYRILIGEPGGKRPLGRPRPIRWTDNVRSNLGEIKCSQTPWMELPRDRGA